jgi:hypothetical protein
MSEIVAIPTDIFCGLPSSHESVGMVPWLICDLFNNGVASNDSMTVE